MAIVYLRLDQILMLHDQVISADGGLVGIRSHDALASAVAQPQQTVFGEDAYPTVAEKGAAYAFFLATGHPFNDANKRTAVFALETFLAVNGYELRQEDQEIEDVIVALASGGIGQGEFFGWVGNHVRPLDQSNVAEFPKPSGS